MQAQKIGTFDRNNLNRHRHKQTQLENVVLFCSELDTFTLLRDVSSIHFTVPEWLGFRNDRGWTDKTGVSFLSPQLHFHVYSFTVHHVQHLSPSLFLVTTFPQHNSPPVLSVLPALQGVTLYARLHPPTLQHNTSLSCNFFPVPLGSQRFIPVMPVCSNPEHPGKIPTQPNILKENMSVLTKICIKIKAWK